MSSSPEAPAKVQLWKTAPCAPPPLYPPPPFIFTQTHHRQSLENMTALFPPIQTSHLIPSQKQSTPDHIRLSRKRPTDLRSDPMRDSFPVRVRSTRSAEGPSQSQFCICNNLFVPELLFSCPRYHVGPRSLKQPTGLSVRHPRPRSSRVCVSTATGFRQERLLNLYYGIFDIFSI